MSFIQTLHAENTMGRTANGAKTYTTTGSELLNFYAQAGAMRGKNDAALDLFKQAYREDNLRAIRAAFYIRDVRGGQGERDLFRTFLNWIKDNDRKSFNVIVKYVPEYGRWDDLLNFVGEKSVSSLLKAQLLDDYDSVKPSLLAKWLPTINASSENTKREARNVARVLEMPEQAYRQIVRNIRRKLNTVESQMTARQWANINYSAVPSQASKLYRKAFKRHDETRYTKFIEAAAKGEVKINASTVFPHEIYTMVKRSYTVDKTAEALWKQLPDYTQGKNAIPIIDVSGSMQSGAGGVVPMSVSVSLGLYFAERNTGPFKDYFITFETSPHILKVKGDNLKKKINNIEAAPWGGSTNLQAVFDLLLSTAIKLKTPAHEMPETLYIISDMEFNVATGNRYGTSITNFKAIEQKYNQAGYKRPNIVFWNVNARGGNVPVSKDENNTTLVSGFSPTIFAMAVEGLTPEKQMLSILDGPRYSAIVLE